MSLLKGLAAILGSPLALLIGTILRCTRRRVGLALLFHRVGDPPGDSAHDLVPALGSRLYEAELRHLGRHYSVVPASMLLAAASGRRRFGRFPVAITFDDDLPSHVRVAMGPLVKLGLTATFFLSGASLERPFAFWWERLQLLADQGRLGEAMQAVQPVAGRTGLRIGEGVHGIAAALEEMPASDRAEASGQLGQLLGSDPPDAGLRADGVRALVEAGFGVGFHTLGHDRLTELDDEALGRAMTAGRDELAAIVGEPLSVISYPHGKADDRVAQAAAAAGFSAGYTGQSEPVTETTDPLLLGRLEPSFRSRGHFALKLAHALLGSA